ncbi:MAG: universal stress protein [Rhodomicrobium sp.]|nr:universal stress protein [Rhodomicrobium sp.]
MYKHILIPTDGSELSEKAIHHGVALAKALGAEVTIATATEPWDAVIVGEVAVVLPPQQYEQTASKTAENILSAARRIAEKDGLACHALHIKDRHPAEGIVDAVKEKGCDLIVMASHGRRGFSRLILGSEANEVVTHSPVPVLIVR